MRLRLTFASVLAAKHNDPMSATEAARTLGRRGGLARAARLTAEERRAIASHGGRARSLSFHAARRIRENFRYLAAVDALRPPAAPVTRMRTCAGPLPGSSPAKSADEEAAGPRRRRR